MKALSTVSALFSHGQDEHWPLRQHLGIKARFAYSCDVTRLPTEMVNYEDVYFQTDSATIDIGTTDRFEAIEGNAG